NVATTDKNNKATHLMVASPSSHDPTTIVRARAVTDRRALKSRPSRELRFGNKSRPHRKWNLENGRSRRLNFDNSTPNGLLFGWRVERLFDFRPIDAGQKPRRMWRGGRARAYSTTNS